MCRKDALCLVMCGLVEVLETSSSLGDLGLRDRIPVLSCRLRLIMGPSRSETWRCQSSFFARNAEEVVVSARANGVHHFPHGTAYS